MLSACLYTLAAPPYEWAGAAWFALTPFFLVLQEKTFLKAFIVGLPYGILFCTGIAYWVYFAISTYFPVSAPIALLLTLLSYSLFIGVYTGLAAAFASLFMRGSKRWLRGLGVPAAWVCGEFARSMLFSGFSWGLLGYTQYRHLALIQISDVVGVYGISFLLAFSSYVMAEAIESFRISGFTPSVPHLLSRGLSSPRFPWPALTGLVIGIAGILSYGALRLSTASVPLKTPPLKLALIRGDVLGDQRWQRIHYARTLLQYAAVSQRSIENEHPDLVVWPEFAVGFYPDKEPPLRAQLSRLTQRLASLLLLGAPRAETINNPTQFYNSAYLLAPDGALLNVYDKIRLLPFAESWPASLPPLLPNAPESPTDFTAGKRSTIFSLSKSTFGVLICYEVTYPHLARRSVQGGAGFLINLSNESWLGGKAASAQHLSMAIFRAVENRRYVARATTNGISGFIDSFGRVNQLSEDKEGGLVGTVSPQQDLTLYSRYGDWFVYACIGFVLFAGLQTRFRTAVMTSTTTNVESPMPQTSSV